MRLVRSFREILPEVPTVCCIGAFDGVHRGHQHLIGSAVHEAHRRRMRSAVLTFFPHPRAVLGRTQERYLTLPDEKAVRIAALDVDVLMIHEFTAETIHTRAEEFIESMQSAFDLRSLWAGPDFAFGYRREGTIAWLKDAGVRRGFDVHVAEPFMAAGRPVSSSRVREALLRGDMDEVTSCLGRPYSLTCRIRTAPGHAGVTPRAAQGTPVILEGRQWWPSDGEYVVTINGDSNRLVLENGGSNASLKKSVDGESINELQIDFA